MALDIIVCIKQVPDPEQFSKITLDPVRGTIRREGIPSVINPLDKHAIEEALRIRERFVGRVTAISMGPPQAKEALQEAMAMGVDEAVLLCDRALAGADTWATAYPLAEAIKKIGRFDVVLCGNETVDGATAQVGPQLAELLDIPHVTHVTAIEFASERSWVIKRAIERGYMKVALELPALIAVLKEINQPRLPSVIAIMEAAGKEISNWVCRDMGLAETMVGLGGSPTQVVGTFEQEVKRAREIIQGSEAEVAKKAVRRLKELGVL